MKREDYVQRSHKSSKNWKEVRCLGDQLEKYLSQARISKNLAKANQPGNSSAEVQKVFSEKAKCLGFRSEAKGLFEHYQTPALRPDYYRKIGKTGVILEVERGKTTINNMDFLDFWKCHICKEASYLILMVPEALRQNDKMKPRDEFQRATDRLGSFFQPENYTNVRGLILIGY